MTWNKRLAGNQTDGCEVKLTGGSHVVQLAAVDRASCAMSHTKYVCLRSTESGISDICTQLAQRLGHVSQLSFIEFCNLN